MTAFKFALLGLCLVAMAMTTSCGRKGDPTPTAVEEEEDGGAADGGDTG